MAYRFPVRRLEQFLLKSPRIQNGFFIKAVHDLRSAQRQLVIVGRLSILKRLAVFLLDCAAHKQYFDSRSHTLTIPMKREEIADYLGTSTESVIRALAQLEELELVRRLTSRTLELHPAELRIFAGIDFD
jgi:CRP-like cAMP-binding protein